MQLPCQLPEGLYVKGFGEKATRCKELPEGRQPIATWRLKTLEQTLSTGTRNPLGASVERGMSAFGTGFA